MVGEPTWFDAFKEWLDTKFASLDERHLATSKALELQAKEYERRLDDLNHAHARAIEVQNTFVSLDKYEDKLASEATARTIANERLNERLSHVHETLDVKLEDYIKRAEARQNELDLAIAAQKGAADEAARASEDQFRKSQELVRSQARKQALYLGITGFVLTVAIALANYLGS